MFIGGIWQETFMVCFNVLSQLSLQLSNQNSVQKYERKTWPFDKFLQILVLPQQRSSEVWCCVTG